MVSLVGLITTSTGSYGLALLPPARMPIDGLTAAALVVSDVPRQALAGFPSAYYR